MTKTAVPNETMNAAYEDAIFLLHEQALKRPTRDDYKGASYVVAVQDWRIGIETIVEAILRRAGF